MWIATTLNLWLKFDRHIFLSKISLLCSVSLILNWSDLHCAAVATFWVFDSGKFLIFVKFFLLYSFEGFLAIFKLQIRLQGHRISRRDYPWPSSYLLSCSGVAPSANYFKKHRFGTIFLVSESIRKPTSNPSIPGVWPYFPRSAAPGLQRLSISGTDCPVVE